MSRWIQRIRKNKDAKLHQRMRKIKLYDPTYGICEEIEVQEAED